MTEDRKAFEAWATQHDTKAAAKRTLERDASGFYKFMSIHQAWIAWEAAWKAARAAKDDSGRGYFEAIAASGSQFQGA